MYVVKPKRLRDYHGQLLVEKGTSSEFHLREPLNGSPQICYYNDRFWNPFITLSKILIKGRLWLETYEQHMRSGETISYYLSHMG